MTISFMEDDEGKTVVDASGTTLGLVTAVEGDTAYVDPDPGITETLRTSLGWGDADADDYTVKQDAVESRTDETLRLRGDLSAGTSRSPSERHSSK